MLINDFRGILEIIFLKAPTNPTQYFYYFDYLFVLRPVNSTGFTTFAMLGM